MHRRKSEKNPVYQIQLSHTYRYVYISNMLPLWHYHRGRGLKIQFAKEAYNTFCERAESVLHCILEILVGPIKMKVLLFF
jgi:hypothetical protein